MDFNKAIVKSPCRNLINGITTSKLGPPDYEKSLEQHTRYIESLQSCGLEVIKMEAEEEFPDSVFVEDTALLTPHFAVITNPGALSRKGEIKSIKGELENHFQVIYNIEQPGTVDAGDILQVDNQFFAGLSARTNGAGLEQLSNILTSHGYTLTSIPVSDMLHLKSGIAYLGNNNLVVTGELTAKHEFEKYNKLVVIDEEQYAANCLMINGKVLLPEGYPQTKDLITSSRYDVIELDMSEFKKLDGGLSCLSLRF